MKTISDGRRLLELSIPLWVTVQGDGAVSYCIHQYLEKKTGVRGCDFRIISSEDDPVRMSRDCLIEWKPAGRDFQEPRQKRTPRRGPMVTSFNRRRKWGRK